MGLIVILFLAQQLYLRGCKQCSVRTCLKHVFVQYAIFSDGMQVQIPVDNGLVVRMITAVYSCMF